HGTPCLAFAFEEKLRVNVWSEGLKFRLRVGPWLSDAKRAVRAPDDVEIVIRPDQSIPLGVLKQHALRTARGQKFAYVVDAAYHEKNIDRIVALARGAAVNTGIFVVEAVAGFRAHSLSLLMDSVHNLSDEMALVFIYLAFILSKGVSRNLLR